jgi:hypothetical protein
MFFGRKRHQLLPLAKRRLQRDGSAMLEMRPDCERCGTDLPPQAHGAFICSFECTFCAECADELDEDCPNCGGKLIDRPTRTGERLARHPASTKRMYRE